MELYPDAFDFCNFVASFSMVVTINVELIRNKKSISTINHHLQEALEFFGPQKGLLCWKFKIGIYVVLFMIVFLDTVLLNFSLIDDLSCAMIAHLPLLICLQWSIYIEQANRIIECWTDYIWESLDAPKLTILCNSYRQLLSIIDLINSSFKYSSKIIYWNFLLTFIIEVYSIFVIYVQEQYEIRDKRYFVISTFGKYCFSIELQKF